jgi:hypothetical protein
MGLHNRTCGQALRNVDKLPERAERPRQRAHEARIENQRLRASGAAFTWRHRDSGLQPTFVWRASRLSTGAIFSAIMRSSLGPLDLPPFAMTIASRMVGAPSVRFGLFAAAVSPDAILVKQSAKFV